MYLGIDIGGSKILIGLIEDNGVIAHSIKITTPQVYEDAIEAITAEIKKFGKHDFRAAGVGIPATHIDRRHGVGVDFANLPWKNVHIARDIERLAHCPVVIENDAKLASLSEAMLRKHLAKVLYVTVSTGIGYGLTVNGKIDSNIGDGGGRLILVEHRGKLVPWESFASGRAIVARYGKPARDIKDAATWGKIARDLTPGFLQLIAVTQPDVIVVGGSVGHYFERLHPSLKKELKKHETPLMPIPPMEEATRPEEAVLFGCYDIAEEVYGRSHR